MRVSKKFMKPFRIRPLLLLSLVLILNSSVAIGGITASRLDKPYNITHGTDRFKILSVLENKIERQNLPEKEKSKLLKKAKNKLFTLNDSQIRLLVSLSERTTNSSHTAAEDIAFLLITALIVLS
jgi:hypothetical protein